MLSSPDVGADVVADHQQIGGGYPKLERGSVKERLRWLAEHDDFPTRCVLESRDKRRDVE